MGNKKNTKINPLLTWGVKSRDVDRISRNFRSGKTILFSGFI